MQQIGEVFLEPIYAYNLANFFANFDPALAALTVSSSQVVFDQSPWTVTVSGDFSFSGSSFDSIMNEIESGVSGSVSGIVIHDATASADETVRVTGADILSIAITTSQISITSGNYTLTLDGTFPNDFQTISAILSGTADIPTDGDFGLTGITLTDNTGTAPTLSLSADTTGFTIGLGDYEIVGSGQIYTSLSEMVDAAGVTWAELLSGNLGNLTVQASSLELRPVATPTDPVWTVWFPGTSIPLADVASGTLDFEDAMFGSPIMLDVGNDTQGVLFDFGNWDFHHGGGSDPSLTIEGVTLDMPDFDEFYGGSGNDTVFAYGEGHYVDGGSGTDTVVYDDFALEMVVTDNGNGTFSVEDYWDALNATTHTPDLLTNVELVSFLDGTFSLTELAAGLADDGFEDNDTMTTAANLDPFIETFSYEDSYGSYSYASFDATLSLADGEDWFSFTVPVDGMSWPYIGAYNDAYEPMTLTLFDGSGNQIATNSDGYLSAEWLDPGQYFVQLTGTLSNPRYQLYIDGQIGGDAGGGTGGGGYGDWYEDNDSASWSWYFGSFEGDVYESGLTVNSGDEDWYSFDTWYTGAAGDGLHFESDGQITVQLHQWDETGTATVILDSDDNSDGSADISFEGRDPGYYMVRVTSPSSSDVNYWVSGWGPTWDDGSGGTDESVGPDSFEDNDSLTAATNVATAFSGLDGLYEAWNLSVESNDSDWYTFDLGSTAGPGAGVEIYFQHSYGDVDMELYDANGNPIAGGYSVGDGEFISLAGMEAGTYYLNVYGYSGASNPWYDIRIDTGGSGDDWWEENDTAWEAPYMGMFEGTFEDSGFVIRSGDDDWYSFDLYGASGQAQDGTYGIQVALDDPNGNAILELYSSADLTTPVRSATSTNGVAAIDFGGLADGLYYIRGTTPDTDARYGYTVSGSGPSTQPTYNTTPDAAEDNDYFEAAADLGALAGATTVDNATFGGTGSLTIDPTDPDWYTFEIGGSGSAGDEIAINVVNGGSLSWYDLEVGVYDQNGNWVTGGYAYSWTDSSNGQTYTENWAASLEWLQSGRYYIGVENWNGSGSLEYTLSTQAPTQSVISPDAYEDNDSFTQAYNLGQIVDTTQTLTGLTMRPWDEDWYRFTTLGEGGATDALTLSSTDSTSNLNFELYDATGYMITGSWSGDSTESINLQYLPAGEYYVRVYEETGSSNSDYSLSITAPAESQSSIAADRFEDNDTRAGAYGFGTVEGINTFSSLTAESGDSDWYSFTTTASGGVDNRVAIDFAHSAGDVDMELYDANGNWLTGSYSVSDNESVSLNGRPAGTYYVHVYGYSGAENSYNLRINAPVQQTFDVAADGYEGSEPLSLGTLGGATSSYGGSGSLTIHEGDEDIFTFSIGAGDIGNSSAAVNLTFSDAAGDIDMELYALNSDGSFGAYINGAYSVSDNETISLSGLGAGNYGVRVYGWEPNGDYSIALAGGVDTAITADRYEDNDTAGTARALGRLTGSNSYQSLSVEANDDDWYSFSLASRGLADDYVRLNFQHALGDVDMELYRANSDGTLGSYVSGSYSVSNSEYVSLEGLTAGNYYVRVYGYAGASNPEYSLTIDGPSAVTLTDDSLEDNDTRSTATALDLSSGSDSRNDLVITQADPDWFSFSLTGNEIAGSYARIDFSHAAGDVDMELYDANGNWLTGSYSVSNQERIDLAGYDSGTYYLRVYGYNDARNPDYDLNVNVVTGVGADRFENNDTRDTATRFGAVQGNNSWTGLTAQSNDYDWYSFQLQNTGRSGHQLEVLFSHAQGDVDVELYDADGNWVGGGYSVSDNETISLNGLSAGRYLARVYGYNGASNPDYSINITAPAPLVDDGYEDNDTQASASNLGSISGQRSFTGLAALDHDWYSFSLDNTGASSDGVEVRFSHALGDVDVALYDSASNWVGGSYSVSDNEYISFAGLAAGTYYLDVYGWAGAQNPEYGLVFRAEGAQVLADQYEDNDTAATATRLRELTSRHEWTGLSIDSGDGGLSSEGASGGGDWYRFSLAGRGQSGHYVETLFSHALGDVDMQLFSADNQGNLTLVGGSYSIGNSERISLTGLDAGSYYVRVYGYNGAVNPDYSLVVNAPEATVNIAADGLESNDTMATATELIESSVSLTGLSIHAGDVDGTLDGDWFKFTMDRAGTSNDFVRINFSHALGDVDMGLYAEDGTRLRVSQGVGDSETISLSGLAADTYYVRVYGYANATNPQYSLSVEAPVGVGAEQQTVTADQYEDNDSQSAATSLGTVRGESSYENLTIDSGDNQAAASDAGDWYAVTVEGNGELEVSIAFDHGLGDVDLQLYDAGGTLLDGSYSIGNSETVSVDVTGASSDSPATYYVRAYGYQSATNSYSMTVDAPFGNQISPDRLESNNSAGTATAIRDAANAPDDLTIHDASDVDWFSFEIPEGATGTLADHVAVSYEGGPISFQLYGSDGTTLIGGNTDSDGRTGIALNGQAAGTYYLKVAGVDGSTISNYDIDLHLPSPPAEDQTPAQDALTLFVYLAADNNLEGAALDDINEMESVNLPDNVNVVVLVDRAQGYTSADGDWTDTRVGVISHDNNPNVITSNLQSVGTVEGSQWYGGTSELNTGHQQTLTDFLNWGIQNFAADNYGVVIWNHGGGLYGSAWDDASSHDNLSVAEVTAALQTTAHVAENSGNFGLIGFDACLQAIASQALDLQTADGSAWLSDVFVASEDLEPGDGWDYAGLLQRVADNPTLSMADLGAAIVETYDDFYHGRSTQSALQTSGFDNLVSAIDGFVNAIDPNGDSSGSGATSDDWTAIVQARTLARQFYDANYRDLGGFMQAIADNDSVSQSIRSAAQGVATALNNSLIRQVDVNGANGLSIYLPANSASVPNWYNDSNFRFLADSRWDDFLGMFTDDSLGGSATGGGGGARARADFAEAMDRSGFITRSSNDTRFEAYDLGEVFGTGVAIQDVSIETGDVDWFRFQLAGAPSDGHVVTISFDHGDTSDLVLGLYDNQGRELTGSNRTSDTSSASQDYEQVSLAGLEVGREYFIRVAGADSADSASYTLSMTAPDAAVGTRSEGGRDFAEAYGGNDSAAKAWSLGQIQMNERLPTITGLTIDATDAEGTGGDANATGGDWYVLNPSRGTDWNPNGIVVTRDDNSTGNLDLYVYEMTAEGLALISSSVTDRTQEWVSFPETNDPIYIQVVGDEGVGYEMDIARRTLDVDGDERVDAGRDAYILRGYLSGYHNFTPDWFDNFVGNGAQRTDAEDIVEYLEHAANMLDVDGNGLVNSNDEYLLRGYLSNYHLFTPDWFDNFVDLNNGTRTSASEIADFLEQHLPSVQRAEAFDQGLSPASRQGAVPDQVVWIDDLSAYAGQTVSLTVQYTTDTASGADNTVTQLDLRMHYDPTAMTFVELTDVYSTGLVASPYGDYSDGGDFDGDASTTRLVYTKWEDAQTFSWPGADVTLPINLYTVTFTVADDATSAPIAFTGIPNSDNSSGTFELNDPNFSSSNNIVRYELDIVPTITVAANAGGEASGSVSYTISLSNALSSDVTVAYSLGASGDTAASGDYNAGGISASSGLSIASGTITIAAGTTSGTITVPVVDDELVEGDETLTLTLSEPSGAIFAGGQDSISAQATISDDDSAVMSIANAANVAEGDSGDTTDMTFTVSLDKASVNAITVNYTAGASGDTATSGDDYTATSGTLTIAAGETSGTITVPVLGDNADEGNETLTVTLSGASGATLGTATATGTIVDDDVVASIADATLVEGDDGSANMVFTVTLSRNATSDVSIAYATADGSAAAGSDYTATSGTLTIAAGQNSGTISVPVLGDTVVEGDETFTLTLSDAQNAHLSGGGATLAATGTIGDDDTATVSIAGPSSSVDEASGGSLDYTVTMSNPASSNVTVSYSLGGTGTAGTDFTDSGSGSVTINAGETSATISLPVTDDEIQEGSESVAVTLTGTDNASVTVDGANASATGAIADDDTVTVTVANATVTEGASGETATAEFALSLNLASTSDITMDYTLAHGTTELGDFDPGSITASDGITVNPAAGTITVAAGTTSGTISVTVNGDDVDEGSSETFDLQLSNLAGAQDISFGDSDGGTDMTATATITDDDDAVVTVTGPGTVDEDGGTAAFTVNLSLATESGVTVNYGTANGTAIAGFGDYTAVSGGTVTFAAGETGDKAFTVAIADDAIVEGDETFTVNTSLADGSEATLADGDDSHTVTIVDNDTAVISNIALTQQGTESNRQMVITVTLSAALASAVTIDYATADETAEAGSDYTAKSGTLVIAPGNTTGTIRVPVADDTLYEGGDETFTVTLSNASIDIAEGVETTFTNTITDNDNPPTVSVEDVVVNEGDGTATFTVTLSNPSDAETTVTYATADGTATAGEDYTAVTDGSLTIAAGETTGTFTVDITDDSDAADAAAEDFTVTVTAGASNDTATGTILDDDSLWAVVRDVTVDEASGKAVFTVRLTQAASEDVAIDYATADGTALAGSDYTAASGTLTIAAGDTSGTIEIDLTDDTVYEGSEAFTLDLTGISGGGAQLAANSATATIVDPAPTVSVADVTQAEDGGNLTFTVTLSESVGSDVTFNYSFADGAESFTVTDGDATGGGTDYDSTGGSGTITAGQTSTTIVVPLTADTTAESDEAFTLTLDTLGGAAGVSFASGGASETAIGVIANDDSTMAVVTRSAAGTWGIQPIADSGGGDWSADPADFIQLGNYGLDWQPVGVVPLSGGGFDILAWNSDTADFGIMRDAESYQRINVIDNYGANWRLVDGADLDSDGNVDLLVQDTSTGRMGVLAFASEASDDFTFQAIGTQSMQAVGFVDLGNDGVTDILLSGDGGAVGIIPGSAGDAFDFSADAVDVGSFGDGWAARGGTDADGDGLLDILLRYEGTDAVPEGDFGLLEVDANGENPSWDWLNDFGAHWSVDGIGLYQ